MSSDDGAPRITPRDLHARIQAGTAPPVFDVRSRVEYEQGHVPGARHLPFWSVALRRDTVQALGEGPVVVYCGQGPRAGMAALVLRLAGLRHVLLLEGHMRAWTRTGLPEERAREQGFGHGLRGRAPRGPRGSGAGSWGPRERPSRGPGQSPGPD